MTFHIKFRVFCFIEFNNNNVNYDKKIFDSSISFYKRHKFCSFKSFYEHREFY